MDTPQFNPPGRSTAWQLSTATLLEPGRRMLLLMLLLWLLLWLWLLMLMRPAPAAQLLHL